MFFAELALTSLLALAVSAVPYQGHGHSHVHSPREIEKRDQTFNINVFNNCNSSKQIGLFQITSSFEAKQWGSTETVPGNGGNCTIQAPFTESGMRVSAEAQLGTAGVWTAQALMEFGYSSYGGTEGTAYDLSVMEGSNPDIGVGVYPENSECESKTCFPWDCPLDQGWTNEDQTSNGSPADTVCYLGMTDFKVVFCP
jgi:hypothetical protein